MAQSFIQNSATFPSHTGLKYVCGLWMIIAMKALLLIWIFLKCSNFQLTLINVPGSAPKPLFSYLLTYSSLDFLRMLLCMLLHMVHSQQTFQFKCSFRATPRIYENQTKCIESISFLTMAKSARVPGFKLHSLSVSSKIHSTMSLVLHSSLETFLTMLSFLCTILSYKGAFPPLKGTQKSMII